MLAVKLCIVYVLSDLTTCDDYIFQCSYYTQAQELVSTLPGRVIFQWNVNLWSSRNRISFDSEIRLKLKSKTFPMELNFPDLSNLNVPCIQMDSKGKDSESLFETLTSFYTFYWEFKWIHGCILLICMLCNIEWFKKFCIIGNFLKKYELFLFISSQRQTLSIE